MSTSGHDMWLRDFLPDDLNSQNLQARILTYGYDSTLDKSQSYATIHDYSRRLLEALKNARTSPAVCVQDINAISRRTTLTSS